LVSGKFSWSIRVATLLGNGGLVDTCIVASGAYAKLRYPGKGRETCFDEPPREKIDAKRVIERNRPIKSFFSIKFDLSICLGPLQMR